MFRAGSAPDDRRCVAIVTDKRSKHRGKRCVNWSVRREDGNGFHELCAAHLGIPQAVRARESETIRILGTQVPEDVLDRENEIAAEELQLQAERFLVHQQEKLEEELAVAAEAAEARRKELEPPELTSHQREAGYLYVRRYGELPSWAPTIRDEHGELFIWTLEHVDDVARREWNDSVNEAEARRDAQLEQPREPWWRKHNRLAVAGRLEPRLPGQPEPEDARREREREALYRPIEVTL